MSRSGYSFGSSVRFVDPRRPSHTDSSLAGSMTSLKIFISFHMEPIQESEPDLLSFAEY